MSRNTNEQKSWWSRHAWIVAILLTVTVITILVCLKCCNPVTNTPGDPIIDNGNTGIGSGGDLEVEQPAPHTHTWGEYVETTPATCLNEGIWTATCTCGATTTKTTPANEHQPTTWTRKDNDTHVSMCQCGEYEFTEDCEFIAAEVFYPDCEYEGYTIFCCTECENMYMGDKVPATGHVWGDWIDNGNDTHKRDCENCIATQTEDCYGGTADCENGAICIICNQEYADPIGHAWGDWIDNGDGRHVRICAIDSQHVEYGDHWIDDMAPVHCPDCGAMVCQHFSVDRTMQFDENGHWEYCEMCSTIIGEKEEHSFEEIGREEYCTEEGTVTYTCVCGSIKKETIPAIDHDWSDWVDNGDGEHKRVCANDSEHIEYNRHNGDETGHCIDCGILVCAHPEDSRVVEYDENHHWTYCSICSNIVDEKSEHQYEEGKRVEYCDQEGEVKYSCACGYFYNATIPATGHNWGDWIDNGDGEHKRVCDNDASHIEYERHLDTGEKPGYCGTCDALICAHNGKMYYDHDEDTHWEYCGVCSTPVTEKFAHQYEETDREEYCTEEGTITYTCVCGSIKRETIPATGHDWSDWIDNGDGEHKRVCDNDASHIEYERHLEGAETPGYCGGCGVLICPHYVDYYVIDFDEEGHWAYCSYCETILEEKEAHSNTPNEVYPSDCENNGLMLYKCDHCGLERTEPIPATGHDWSDWVSNNDGTHWRVCGNNEEEIEQAECSDFEIKVIVPISCDGPEEAEYTCKDCGNKHMVIGDENLPHVWGDWTYYDQTSHSRTCLTNDHHVEFEDHSYVEVSREEFCEEEGTVTYACVCGDSYTESIDPVGHAWGAWQPQNRKSLRVCANDESHTELVSFFAGNTILVSTGNDMAMAVHRKWYDAYPGMYIEFVKPVYDEDGNVIYEEPTIISETYSTTDTLVKYLYRNIAAKEMTVGITVRLFSGEGELLSEVVVSVRDYVESQLKKDHPMALKTLLVDMLNYGAAAQINFNYLTDDLANKNVTEEQATWATQETPTLTNNEVITKGEDGKIEFITTAVSLENTVKLNVHFKLGNGCNLEDFNIVFAYKNSAGNETRRVFDGTDALAIQDGYRITFDILGVSAMRKIATISFEDKETGETIGDIVQCSVESYLAQKYEENTDETFRELLILIMKYGDSTNKYLQYVNEQAQQQ